MTIESIIRNGGKSHAWRVTTNNDGTPNGTRELTHYSTCMAIWRENSDGTTTLLYTSLGHGSKSDQNGMNTLFRTLGLPYYYSRAGGAEIVELCTCDLYPFNHQHCPSCN